MTKFTKGPWRVMLAGGETYVTDFPEYAPDPLALAQVFADKSGQRLEDARLIAASPEMHALLREMADYMSDIPESAVGGDDYAVSLCRRARRVLAKVEAA